MFLIILSVSLSFFSSFFLLTWTFRSLNFFLPVCSHASPNTYLLLFSQIITSDYVPKYKLLLAYPLTRQKKKLLTAFKLSKSARPCRINNEWRYTQQLSTSAHTIYTTSSEIYVFSVRFTYNFPSSTLRFCINFV